MTWWRRKGLESLSTPERKKIKHIKVREYQISNLLKSKNNSFPYQIPLILLLNWLFLQDKKSSLTIKIILIFNTFNWLLHQHAEKYFLCAFRKMWTFLIIEPILSDKIVTEGTCLPAFFNIFRVLKSGYLYFNGNPIEIIV